MSIEPSKQTLGSGVFAHAVGTLELEPVLANICARCHNRSAGELIKALRPGTDRARIEESLLQIAETRAFQELRGRLSTPDTSARQWLVSGGRESLPAEALLEIAAVERSAVELRKTIDKDDLPLVTLRAAV